MIYVDAHYVFKTWLLFYFAKYFVYAEKAKVIKLLMEEGSQAQNF